MKLLSIPIFLGLLLYVLYAQSIEEETVNTYSESKPTEKYMELIEKNEVFTSSREENVEVKVENKEETAVEDVLQLDIGVDINTTRDKEVMLTVYVENLEEEEEEGCNYFWRDGKDFLGVGDSISVTFKKGKHNITVHVQTTDGREGNASKLIRAWEYRKEATLYYSEKTGEFLYKRVSTYNYQDNLIQVKGKNSLKTYTYDDKGQEIGMNYEDYDEVEYSRSSSSEYDENGNMVKNESLDADGSVVWSERGEYNDQNETVSYLMGENENTLEEIMGEEEEEIEEELEGEGESTEANDDNDKYVYDKNDNLLKSEYSYGTVSVKSEMTYDDNNQTLTETRHTKDGNYSYGTDYKYTYDGEGNVATIEREESEDGKIYCHYITTSTYNDDGYVLKESNKILSGDCTGDVYDLYVENTYDKEGNIVNTKSKTYTKENEKEMKDEISELHRTMKRENYYSNDLDD